MRKVAAAVVAIAVLVVAFYVVILDQWAGLSRFLAFNLVVVAVMGVLGLAALLLTRSRMLALVPAVAVVALLAFVRVVDLSPVKPALRAVERIKPGMTEAEVRAILAHAFPTGGRFKRPNIGPRQGNTLSFVLDPTDGDYDASGIEVQFENGRCLSARFFAD
jgi:hypothetical protein